MSQVFIHTPGGDRWQWEPGHSVGKLSPQIDFGLALEAEIELMNAVKPYDVKFWATMLFLSMARLRSWVGGRKQE